jgi:hypothetical protein
MHLTYRDSPRTLCGEEGPGTEDPGAADCDACHVRAYRQWW